MKLKKPKHPLLIVFALLIILPMLALASDVSASFQKQQQQAFDKAYQQGYHDGALQARVQIFEKLHRNFSVLAYLNDPDYGMCPEKAIDILSQYESGRSTSIAQIERSIRLLKDFFSDLESLINEVQNYDVG